MALNTRTEYALRVLLELADGDMVSAQKICDRQQLPKKYIEHLLALLKNAGIVKSTAGSKGGYSLTRPAAEITFAQILKAVEDYSFSTSCLPDDKRFCVGKYCNLSRFFSKLNRQLEQLFGSYNLEMIHKIYTEGNK
ncbi:MAG: Rrf2 family transcriptional regulator [Candidatus Cloacimonetes bacterium]|nr:Rrf2 family transcriptional regulator [Candidatus Cloacimonadota bacterium]